MITPGQQPGSKAKRRWEVRRLSYTDIWNDTVDIIYLNNGYWGYALDVSPIACWPSRYGSVIVKGAPTLGLGHDYLYDDVHQCQHYIFPESEANKWGTAYAAFTGRIGFVTNPEQMQGQDTWSYISPEAIDPDLPYFGFWVDRVCTSRPASGTVKPIVDMAFNKTPMVYLAADESGTPIWRNDNNPQTPGETFVLSGIPGSGNKTFIVKPVYVPWTARSLSATIGNVYLAIYVSAVARSGTKLRVRPLGPYVAGNVYTDMFPPEATYAGTVTSTGWLYVRVDHERLREGWNYFLIDINASGNQAGDSVTIGIDTTVTTSLQNRAWFWYNTGARDLGVLRTVYTFYRDIDKIRWHARNVSFIGYWNGPFGLTYNTQIVGGPFSYRPFQLYDRPFGHEFGTVPCHLDHAPTHAEFYTIGGFPSYRRVKQNVMINTGTSGQWNAFLYQYKEPIGLELGMWHTMAESSDIKEADMWYGIRLYGRVDGGISRPGWDFTIKPIRLTGNDIEPSEFYISHIHDRPWGRSFTQYEADEHRGNDFVLYFNQVTGGSTKIPACEVDISRMVRFYHNILP